MLLEYGKTTIVVWMFIEGFYLNSLIAVAFFQGPSSHAIYYAVGWGKSLSRLLNKLFMNIITNV